MRSSCLVAATAFCVLALGSGLAAQKCGVGEILLKNDAHPAQPSGKVAVGIVRGLCNSEAAMSVFKPGSPVKVKKVAVMFGAANATNGVKAAVDIEIYDGATVDSKGKWKLGPQVYKLSKSGSNLQIQSHALNEFTLPTAVLVSSGTVVIGFRMIQNLATGSCSKGYTANFSTDAKLNCNKGINILDAIKHGPVDPNSYTGFGVGLCPLIFRGSWMIRACVEPQVSLTWSGNATPGGVLSFTYRAPNQSGNTYLAFLSMSKNKGFTSPWGYIPLDPDELFVCSLFSCSNLIISRTGKIGSNGSAAGGLIIPNVKQLKNSGFTLYGSFATWKGTAINKFVSVAPPSKAIVIN